MIDTIRFRTLRKLKIPEPRFGWKKFPNNAHIRGLFVHFPQRDETHVTAIEASLPKVLWGNNARVLQDKAAFQSAWAKLTSCLDEIANPPSAEIAFTRIDLCWNYQTDPIDFFLAHESLNHPSIQKRMITYRNKTRLTGLEWQGTKIRIKFYDKTSAKKTFPKVSKPLVRVEVQLRGAKLRELFNGNPTTPLHEIVWEKCYSVFRDVLLNFPPLIVIPSLSGWDGVALAALGKGVDVFGILSKKMNERSVRDLRKQLAPRLVKKYRVSWKWMLPPEFPPPRTVHRNAV